MKLGLKLLTARQFEVLTYLADGYTDKELANLRAMPLAPPHAVGLIFCEEVPSQKLIMTNLFRKVNNLL